MTHYVHHVPGRLRVKTPMLKRQELRAREVKSYLQNIVGVLEVEISTVTGSAVIKYDPSQVNSMVLLNSVRDLGLVHPEHASRHHGGMTNAGSPLANTVANTFFNKLVETAIEKSAIALIAAVI
jgi:copper chaperone CopZ